VDFLEILAIFYKFVKGFTHNFLKDSEDFFTFVLVFGQIQTKEFFGMRFFTTFAVVLSILAFPCCTRRAESGYRTIAYVNTLLSDSLPALQALSSQSGKPSGDIVLIGDPSSCLRLSEHLMLCDHFDNIDARKVPDGLSDFAGETVSTILDFEDFPIDSLASAKDEAVREAAVRSAILALGEPYHCKVLLLCSPMFEEYAIADVRDLFERIGCSVPVICSSDTLFTCADSCFLAMRRKNIFTHNISQPAARLYIATGNSFVLPFVDSLVPASFPDTVGVLAPNTYYSYVVQNQH
jgi:hypothetical protein